MIKKIKPTTSARRGMTVASFKGLAKKEPEKSLSFYLPKKAGRNAQGKITVRHRGGGARRFYRLIDFEQKKDMPAKVLAIEYDPNRSAYIILLEYEDGKKIYAIAPQGLKVGHKILTGEKVEVKPGNRMILGKIPVGTFVYNIEIYPGRGGQLARSAGTSAQIVGREGKFIHIKLPSGEIRMVPKEAKANVGVVSNPEHSIIKIGKAGRTRHLRIRPTVRGKAMNPVDHPHGGGEGRQSIGLIHPKTPWGKPALGYKTRNKKKASSKMIIRERKR